MGDGGGSGDGLLGAYHQTTVGPGGRPRPVPRTIAWVEAGTSAQGPVPAAEVWERYAGPARWSGWAPQTRRVGTTAARIAAGVTGTVHGPPSVRVAFVVTAVDEAARTWDRDVRWGPTRLHLRHGVEADRMAAPPG